MHNDESYRCRVCGMKQDFQPWGRDGKIPSFEICGCCGVEFGYEDSTQKSIKKYRETWMKNGGAWAIPKEAPSGWSLEEQLKQIPNEYL